MTTEQKNAQHIEDAKFNVVRTTADLRRECQNLISRLERTVEMLNEGDLNVNSLGVVQGAGLDIDRTCALLRERMDTAKLVARIAVNQ